MKYIYAFLLLFVLSLSTGHAAQSLLADSVQGDPSKGFLKEKSSFQIPDLSSWKEMREEKCGLKNLRGYGVNLYIGEVNIEQHVVYVGDCEDKQMQEAVLVEINSNNLERRDFGEGPQHVRITSSLGRFYRDCFWVMGVSGNHVLYVMPGDAVESYEHRYSSKYHLVKLTLADLSYTVLASGSLHDMYDEGKVGFHGKTIDTDKLAPVLANPTNDTISTFIKTELGRQDLDLTYATLKTFPNNLVIAVVVATQHGVPESQEAFILKMRQHTYFLRSLGKFACDTFGYLTSDDESVMFTGMSIDRKDFHFVKSKLHKSHVTASTHRYSVNNRLIVGFQHGNDCFGLVDCRSLWVKPPHEDGYLMEEGDWENLTNTRFMTVNGKFYQITPVNDDVYAIYTVQKTDGRYRRVPTNVISTEYIHTFIPDPADGPKILAYQTGKLSLLTWHFCDEAFQQKVLELSHQVNSSLGEYAKYAWHFSTIPHGDTNGKIEFDDFRLKKGDKSIAASCTASGKIDPISLEAVQFIPFPQPELRMTYGPDSYPIDYAVFRSSKAQHSPLPTVMIVNGGPHVFIEHKTHGDEIDFFNHHGYHVVIPQGLFRQGYSPQYAKKTKGQFGELDMELLRCVLRDVRSQSITSQPVYIMGSSYGGYSCARLAFDSDLVKAAFVANGFLDLSNNIQTGYFEHKDGEEVVDRARRLRLLSPALEAPLPRVPVFMVGIQNDVRCPIAQSRAFAQRLVGSKLPLTYLEHPKGGHSSHFSHLPLIKDFFEGTYGPESRHDHPLGYEVVVDTIQFFK